VRDTSRRGAAAEKTWRRRRSTNLSSTCALRLRKKWEKHRYMEIKLDTEVAYRQRSED